MERTYVFNQDGGAGSSNGLLASILPSLQNRGIDTGYLMGLMGGNGNGGFFGNNGGFQDIIALIVIAAIFGNGNFGFGGNNNQGANEGREMIMQTLNRNGVDIAALAQAVNTSSDQILAGINSVSQAICGLGNQMGQNTNSIITAIMQGNNALTSQICSCCCDMKQLVTTQGYESKLALCDQTHTLVNVANQNALSLRDGATANTQAIIAKYHVIEINPKLFVIPVFTVVRVNMGVNPLFYLNSTGNTKMNTLHNVGIRSYRNPYNPICVWKREWY